MTNQEIIAYKFVKWDISPLKELADSKPYKLRVKVINNETLTREEKNYITEHVNCNSYSKSGIPLQGWLFSFSTALRKHIYGHVDKIIINE